MQHLLAIHNYNHDDLHHVNTREVRQVVVGDNIGPVSDDLEATTRSICDNKNGAKNQPQTFQLLREFLPSQSSTAETGQKIFNLVYL